MTIEIKKDLNSASKLYKAGKSKKAFEIYNKHFLETPEVFNQSDEIRYCLESVGGIDIFLKGGI